MRQLQFALFVQLGMNVIIIVIISSEPLAMAVLVKFLTGQLFNFARQLKMITASFPYRNKSGSPLAADHQTTTRSCWNTVQPTGR
jgi:hypothetical protein